MWRLDDHAVFLRYVPLYFSLLKPFTTKFITLHYSYLKSFIIKLYPAVVM